MCFCTAVLIRCMAVISIVAIIIFWQVHDVLVSVLELGVKGFQVQEMGSGLILRKMFSVKLVYDLFPF